MVSSIKPPKANELNMPILKKSFWDKTRLNKNDYRTYVETGSYRGFMIENVIDEYESIHSIELSTKWYAYCVFKFQNYKHVKLHLGDSKHLLPEVLKDIREPAVIFLEAHYSGGTTARRDTDTPLLDELEIVRERTYDDIIIIDDISFLGAKGGAEPTKPITDNNIWPSFQYDWEDTTEEKVVKKMKKNYGVLSNKNLKMTTSPKEDQYIWYPNLPKE